MYRTALSTLCEYKDRHERIGYDLSYMRGLFGDALWQEIAAAPSGLGGNIVIHAADKTNNSQLTFSQLMESCHSVLREFSEMLVSVEQIESAVEIAMRTPSVCNRQPTRVHIIANKELIRKALDLQGGFRGYMPLPCCCSLLLTTKLS